MDPQLLLMLLPLLMQSMQAGGASGGGGGSPLMSLLGGAGIAGASSSPFGASAPSGTSASAGSGSSLPGGNAVYSGSLSGSLPLALQNWMGGIEGGMSGASMGPWGMMAGAGMGNTMAGVGDIQQGAYGAGLGGLLLDPFFGPLLGNMLWPASVPRTMKTTAIDQALAQSPNSGNQMLADYIQNQVLGKGNVLSSAGGANAGKMAQIVEWLTGSSLPNIGGGNKGGNYTENLGGAGGISVPRDISRLQALLGSSPDLSPAELQNFLPQIESMVGNFGGGKKSGGLPGLAGNIMALIGSLSAQQSAGAPLNAAGGGKGGGAGGVNTPTGTGGNPLAALLGGGGGGSLLNMNALMAKLKQMTGGGGDSGNLVGATA